MSLLLMGSFVAIRSAVEASAGDRIRTSLKEQQFAIAQMAARDDARNRRLLEVAADSAALKAGIELVRAERRSPEAVRTLEDQLRDLCETLGCDFLIAAEPERGAIAGVVRSGGGIQAMTNSVQPPRDGFFSDAGGIYRVTAAAVNEGGENLAVLHAGTKVDLAGFGAPVALLHEGAVEDASVKGARKTGLARALRGCAGAQCEVQLDGARYLVMRADAAYAGPGYALYSFANLDDALADVRRALGRVFAISVCAGLCAAITVAGVSSRSIARPVAGLIEHLKRAEAAGVLAETGGSSSRIREIAELTGSFNRAAVATRESRQRLDQAYVQFIGSLASALDARDRYTAGHSTRVSTYSMSIAAALGLPAAEIESIRIGALLHDIGKIGVPDSVLQKPGRLTPGEVAQIQQHPAIGRQILERVEGFEPYLPVVELHHENWDGSGYPHRLRGEATPLAARIVRVADAFDAMTSDRPYRIGMGVPAAVAIVRAGCGTEFDPRIVEAFLTAVESWTIQPQREVVALCAALSS
jgi:putative nucleotidyltransferase with HDIG domain